MKHFEVGNEIVLNKDYDVTLMKYIDKLGYEVYSFLKVKQGTIFTIIDTDESGYICENSIKERFWFHKIIMQEYFDIKYNKLLKDDVENSLKELLKPVWIKIQNKTITEKELQEISNIIFSNYNNLSLYNEIGRLNMDILNKL